MCDGVAPAGAVKWWKKPWNPSWEQVFSMVWSEFPWILLNRAFQWSVPAVVYAVRAILLHCSITDNVYFYDWYFLKYMKANLTLMIFFLCVSRSPTWRMILTGTQLSSTTGRALCPKTTSTCGHMRKDARTPPTRVYLAHLSRTQMHHTSSAGLCEHLTSEHGQLGGLFCSALDICTLA